MNSNAKMSSFISLNAILTYFQFCLTLGFYPRQKDKREEIELYFAGFIGKGIKRTVNFCVVSSQFWTSHISKGDLDVRLKVQCCDQHPINGYKILYCLRALWQAHNMSHLRLDVLRLCSFILCFCVNEMGFVCLIVLYGNRCSRVISHIHKNVNLQR